MIQFWSLKLSSVENDQRLELKPFSEKQFPFFSVASWAENYFFIVSEIGPSDLTGVSKDASPTASCYFSLS